MEPEDKTQSDSFLLFQTDLQSHPLVHFLEDPLLSLILLPIKQLQILPENWVFEKVASQFGQQLHQEIFGSKTVEELHEDFEEMSLGKKSLCAKAIEKDDLYFRCLDCDMNPSSDTYSLFCVECFENAKQKHHGHRILPQKSGGSAFCDCGDAEILKPEGFCEDHSLQKGNTQDLLQNFPKDILERLQTILPKAFYGVIALYEIGRKQQSPELSKNILDYTDSFLNELFSFFTLCYSDINNSFVTIVELIFKSSFAEPYHRLWHDCNDLKDEKDPTNLDINQPHPCSCLIVENLLRLANVMSVAQQNQFHQIFRDCFGQSESPEFFPNVFTKYLPFLFYKKYPEGDSQKEMHSRVLDIHHQIYLKERLNLQIIDSMSLQALNDLVIKAISSAPISCEVFQTTIDYFTNLWDSIIPMKKDSNLPFPRLDFLYDLLQVVMSFQTRCLYENGKVRDSEIITCLKREKNIMLVLQKGINFACSYPEEEKSTHMKSFLIQWFEKFQRTKLLIEQKQAEGNKSLHPVFERILSYFFVRLFGGSPLASDLEDFLKEALPESKPSKIASLVIEGSLKTVGIFRYVHIMKNVQEDLLWRNYSWPWRLSFNLDILTIQFMAMLVSPEEIFQELTRHFFSYSLELQEFFQNPFCSADKLFQEKLALLEDFFHFLIFLMNDEISMLNVQLQISDAQTANDIDSQSKRILEKALINILLDHFWTDIRNVKNSSRCVLESNQIIDEVIPKITVSDQTTQKIRLKEELVSGFDPYLLYQAPSLQTSIRKNMASRLQKGEDIDFVSGKYYSEALPHLKIIQKKLFQSDLPSFLSSYFHQEEVESSLIRPVLKLILLNLQVASDTNRNEEESKKLREKIEKYYTTDAFKEGLKKAQNNPNLKDCLNCIQKIQGMLTRLNSSIEEENKEGYNSIIKQDSQEEDFKKKAEEEKTEIQTEEVSQSKENEGEKNDPLAEAEKIIKEEKIDDSNKVEEEKVCPFCIDSILETEDYGVPIYVVFTNNFYDISKEVVFKKSDFSDLLKEDWWPVISSCNHLCHKECFVNFRQSSQTKPRKGYSDEYEMNCAVCKTLCNTFLSLNETSPEANFQESASSSLATDLTAFLHNKTSLLNESNEIETLYPEPIPLSQILWRAYFSSIHSLTQIRPGKGFCQRLKLNTQLFRVLLNDLKSEKNSQIRPLTFLERLKENLHDQSKETVQTLFEFQSESLLIETVFDALNYFFSTQSTSPQKIDPHFQTSLQEYFAFKTLQLACFEETQSFKSIDDLISYHQKSESFQDKLALELIYPIQMCLFMSTINNSLLTTDNQKQEKLEHFLLHPNSSPEFLDIVLKAIGFPTSFEKFIESSLLSVSQKSPDDLLPLNFMLSSNDIANQCQIPRIIKYAPAIVELPATFAEFATKYYIQKCSMCNNYNKELLTCICLICGDVFCKENCNASEGRRNLYQHANAYHMGLGVFLGVYNLETSVINYSVGIRNKKRVYVNSLGQGIQDFLDLKQKDWKQFLLAPDFLNYYKDIIENHNVWKEAHYQG